MLTSLHIQNFAIVKALDLDFKQGMTTFTGETGAGKSIMIDALMLALGERADASVVRVGAEKCDITAHFSYAKEGKPGLWLAENDIDEEENVIILRRVIYAEGRSKSWINGLSFPLQKVRELGELLVHIHGQHQHQTLMQHITHREQLDHYADNKNLLQDVQKHYQTCHKIKHSLDALRNQDMQQDRMNLLQFQIQELSQLQLQSGEMNSLHQEHQLLHHAKDYLSNVQQIENLMQGEDQPFSIFHAMHQVLQNIQTLPLENPHIKNAAELMNTALIQSEEAWNEIQSFGRQVQLDPQRLDIVESRMSLLHGMARKYQVDVSKLAEFAENLSNELQNIQNAELRIEQLEKEYTDAFKEYEKSALLLRESRLQASKKLSADITACIQQLGMPKGYITIQFSPLDKMQLHGLDKIEYQVCTNPGMLPDSLSKIASGGELSRISLAIQMITAQRGATPTLLFDEVDVGIGGGTAALVGQMLRKLGERLQVFCVTHQPQVAASAHHHFVVSKFSDTQQTYTNVNYLPKTDGKIEEIARMLGGLTITDETRSHAQALLKEHS